MIRLSRKDAKRFLDIAKAKELKEAKQFGKSPLGEVARIFAQGKATERFLIESAMKFSPIPTAVKEVVKLETGVTIEKYRVGGK